MLLVDGVANFPGLILDDNAGNLFRHEVGYPYAFHDGNARRLRNVIGYVGIDTSNTAATTAPFFGQQLMDAA